MRSWIPSVSASRVLSFLFRGVIAGLIIYIAFAVMVSAQIWPYEQFRTLLTSGDQQTELESSDPTYWIEQVRTNEQYFLHVRHAARRSSIDVQGFDYFALTATPDELGQISDFVCLTDEGTAQALLLGRAVRELNNQLNVVSSPSCRARETALFAFDEINDTNIIHLHRSAIPLSQRDGFDSDLQKYFGEFEFHGQGTTVIVGHNQVAYEGSDWVTRLDGEISRKEGGISILSFDPDTGELTVHYTFERLTDFVMEIF